MPKYLDKTGLSRLWGRMKSVLVTPLSNRVTVLEQNTTTSTDLEELTARVDMLQLKYHTEVSSYNTRTWTKHGKMPWVDYTGATTGGSVGEVSEPTKPAASAQGLTVGAVVAFTGTKHYVSSSSTAPKNCKPGEAKITAVVKGARHPYHLVRTAGSASTVYGWVDATDITTEASGAIVKGSTVKVKKGAKTYTGGGLASFVYSGIYTVLEVSGSRVVIGKGNAVTAAVNIKDLTLVG